MKTIIEIAYLPAGMVVFLVCGELAPQRLPIKRSWVAYSFIWLLEFYRLLFWPIILVDRIANELAVGRAPKWKVDFENVELHTREQVAREIEAYRDRLRENYTPGDGHWEHTGILYGDIAFRVRNPELLMEGEK